MHGWESLPQATYDHNWCGNMLPIKTEPQTTTYPSMEHHHMHHMNQKTSSLGGGSSPLSTPSMDGMETQNFFYDQFSSLHRPLGFNPLTPPGYPNAMIPQSSLHQDSMLNVDQSPLQQLNHGSISQFAAFAKNDGSNPSLTPSHTPPMDVTPPKSPKFPVDIPTPEKDNDLNSNYNDSEDTRSLESDNDDESIRTPKINSHGKVKKFKCKQCNFIAVTKLSFWEHTKGHIKPEKMLKCPKCPFVTEYKHHLEYHLRNHDGSKPFQCNKCSYSCVNKSMLNSHLKSHSNIYQYRCADCSYATKYCHSLKLHLRKYGHKPAMVLNEDGTPNPLPIIDVYGTRRGPKMKSSKKRDPPSQQLFKQETQNGPSSLAQNSKTPPLQQQQQSQQFQATVPTPSPANLMSNFLPTTLASMLQQSGNTMPFFPYLNLNLHMLAAQQQAALAQMSPNMRDETTNMSKCESDEEDAMSDYETDERCESRIDNDAMDLSQTTPTKNVANQIDPIEPPKEIPTTPSTVTSTWRNHRRKGRAFKLDSSVTPAENENLTMDTTLLKKQPTEVIEMDNSSRLEMSGDEDVPTSSSSVVLENKDDASDETNKKPESSTTPSLEVENKETSKSTSPNNASNCTQENYECKFCGISFKDAVLYTIHMGYHGYNDVFKCNMCGEKCEDRISFFLHIARNPHS
uniref:Protein hunchback n=1 Tax=Haematopota pluvialis TaxID=178770 RepID=B4YK60_HAEPU|nr:putative hunchback [Haematopota pluvialis]